jgi:signal transduction histidine kinase
VRNPLNCIQGYAGLLLHSSLNEEEKRRCLQRILSCCLSIETLTHDLTADAAMDNAGFCLNRRWDSLEEVVRESVEAFEVLSNAIKHVAPQGGLIRVSASEFGDWGHEVLVTVADNGDGIAADELDKLSGKFYRARTERRPGLGLGLYNVKRIVEAHGGRLWAQSEGLGRGAAFFFTLPRSLVPSPASGPAKSPLRFLAPAAAGVVLLVLTALLGWAS